MFREFASSCQFNDACNFRCSSAVAFTTLLTASADLNSWTNGKTAQSADVSFILYVNAHAQIRTIYIYDRVLWSYRSSDT